VTPRDDFSLTGSFPLNEKSRLAGRLFFLVKPKENIPKFIPKTGLL